MACSLLLPRFMTRTSGARLEDLQRAAAESPEVISFAGGLPDPRLFPKHELSEAFYSALHASQSLQYGWPEGEPELREWVAARLRRRGADVEAQHVLITSGAQQAISVAARSFVPFRGGSHRAQRPDLSGGPRYLPRPRA